MVCPIGCPGQPGLCVLWRDLKQLRKGLVHVARAVERHGHAGKEAKAQAREQLSALKQDLSALKKEVTGVKKEITAGIRQQEQAKTRLDKLAEKEKAAQKQFADKEKDAEKKLAELSHLFGSILRFQTYLK